MPAGRAHPEDRIEATEALKAACEIGVVAPGREQREIAAGFECVDEGRTERRVEGAARHRARPDVHFKHPSAAEGNVQAGGRALAAAEDQDRSTDCRVGAHLAAFAVPELGAGVCE